MPTRPNFGSVLQRWQQHIAEIEPQPLFDRRTWLIYAILAAELVCGVILLTVLGFSVDPQVLWMFAGWPFVAVSGTLLRRLGYGAFGGAVEATGLIVSQGALSLLVVVPLAAMSAPFADQALSAADKAMGFDWPNYLQMAIPWRRPLGIAYISFLWQELLVIVALFASGRSDRGWQFVTAATIALAITIVIFPFFPAEGPFVYYGLPRAEFEPFVGTVPWEYLADLSRLKAGYRIFDWSVVEGYVSFPSYHTAAALLFTWAIWPLRWFRIPVAVLNIALILGAILIGSHYLIDIIGGAVVAVLALYLASMGIRADKNKNTATSPIDQAVAHSSARE